MFICYYYKNLNFQSSKIFDILFLVLALDSYTFVLKVSGIVT